MSPSMPLLRSSTPWIAILFPPCLLVASFSGCGVLSISITSLVVIVSTIAFTLLKQKHSIFNKSVQQEAAALAAEHFNSHLVDHSSQVKQMTTEGLALQLKHEINVKSTIIDESRDLYSESESQGCRSSSSEDSDIDWPFSGELGQSSSLCSDGSISDEESLIEIALPSGHFVGSKNDPKLSFQHNQKVFADIVPESVFQQQCLMDFLADISDVYEEDNFIEIDISMGSIKCPGFEIAA